MYKSAETLCWTFHKISRLEELLYKRGHFVTGKQSQEEHNNFPVISSFSFSLGIYMAYGNQQYRFLAPEVPPHLSLLLKAADCSSLF